MLQCVRANALVIHEDVRFTACVESGARASDYHGNVSADLVFVQGAASIRVKECSIRRRRDSCAVRSLAETCAERPARSVGEVDLGFRARFAA
jgi:hypothetical protein